MNDGDALHAAIIDNPDDDTPRLVYADWCDENNQAHRAEFIRAQVGLHRLVEDRQQHANVCGGLEVIRAMDFDHPAKVEDRRILDAIAPLLAVEKKILTPAACHCNWHHPINHNEGITFEYRRGFVEKVTLSYRSTTTPVHGRRDVTTYHAGWLYVNERLAQHLPINEVVLTTRPDVTFDRVRERPSRDYEKRCYRFVREWMVYDNDDRFQNTMAIQWSLPEEDLFVHGSERIEDYRPREFEAQTAAARTVEGYLKLRWPKVKTWTVPPDTAAMSDEATVFMMAGDVPNWMNAMRRMLIQQIWLDPLPEQITVTREFEQRLYEYMDETRDNLGSELAGNIIGGQLTFRRIPVVSAPNIPRDGSPGYAPGALFMSQDAEHWDWEREYGDDEGD